MEFLKSFHKLFLEYSPYLTLIPILYPFFPLIKSNSPQIKEFLRKRILQRWRLVSGFITWFAAHFTLIISYEPGWLKMTIIILSSVGMNLMMSYLFDRWKSSILEIRKKIEGRERTIRDETERLHNRIDKTETMTIQLHEVADQWGHIPPNTISLRTGEVCTTPGTYQSWCRESESREFRLGDIMPRCPVHQELGVLWVFIGDR